MLQAYLYIRIKQIQRSSQDIGITRLGLIFALTLLLGIVIVKQSIQNDWYIAITWVTMVISYQLNRKDKLFLQSHFNRYKFLLITEYTIASLPVLCCLLAQSKFSAIGLLMIGNLSVPYLHYKPKFNSINSSLQRLIPADAYEWKSYARKVILLFVPFWITALATSFYTPAIPIAVFILSFSCFMIYEIGEPIQMILAFEKEPKQFLLHKFKRNLYIYWVIVLPLLLTFCVFHPNLWYLVATEIFIFTLLHLYLTTLKYAFYSPNQKAAGSNIFLAIGTITAIVPIFSPVLIALTIKFYFKSIQNLKSYL